MQIQEGDVRLRNQFITDYQPYVAKVTSRFCKRYIDPAKDDEFSIALGAFNEAINQFSQEAGRSFLGFAEQVMRRRLIDYVRKEQRFSQQMPYSLFDVEDDEDNIVNPVEIHQAIEQYEKQKGMEERQGEIIDLNRCLSDFGIQFADLVDASPKHDDSRQALFVIGKQLSENTELMRIMLTKRMLPIKELLDLVEVSRKTLERNRKFIIAVALIYNGPYPYLRDYLHIKQDM
nr:RNA polymerase sigma factor SigI [Paenibacillus piri]